MGKADVESQLENAQKMLASEEQARQDATAEKKRMGGEIPVVKKDIEDLEMAVQKIEQEKTNRDHNIRSLTDEVAQQDEVINKLNKEKKMIADNQAKSFDDLQAAEEKVAHL